jgi:hypothetical protein
MYNPLARSQVGANVTAFLAGRQAYVNGRTQPLDVLHISLGWRAYYKMLTFTVLMTGMMVLCALSTGRWYLLVAQVALDVWVFGVTYVSLVLTSDFQKRWLFRKFFRAWMLVPNVARFWWYCALFLPFWVYTLQTMFHHGH